MCRRGRQEKIPAMGNKTKKKKRIKKRKRKIYISQPGSTAWEGDIIPLHHEILHSWIICKYYI